MLTTQSDREQGVLADTFYATIPFDEPGTIVFSANLFLMRIIVIKLNKRICIGIIIEYDINSFELIFKAKVARVNKATVFRDEKEYWHNALVLSKESLEGHWFYCFKNKANVKVILVEKNKNILFTKSKSKELKPIRCLIAWAVGKNL